MRLALLLCTCLFTASLQTAVMAKDKTEAPRAVQFIDRSNIFIPEKVEDFVVDSHTQDPGVFGGVSIGYVEPTGLPRSFTVTAYVYPIGRVETEKGLAAGLNHIVEGVTQSDVYSDRKIDPDTAFTVPAPAAEIPVKGKRKRETVIGPASEPAPDKPATEDDLSAAVAELTPPATTAGRRVVMQFNSRNRPVRSIGYIFYRQMMLVKLRMTVDAEEIDEAGFLALADKTATTLAPSFLIQNFGECGVARIPLGKEGEKDPSEGRSGAVALMREMGRLARESCAATEGEPDPVPKGMLRHTLVYPTGTWN